MTYLILAVVVREVGNHNLGLGWDAILRWASLAGLTRSTRLLLLGAFGGGGGGGSGTGADIGRIGRFDRGVRQGQHLTGDVDWGFPVRLALGDESVSDRCHVG